MNVNPQRKKVTQDRMRAMLLALCNDVALGKRVIAVLFSGEFNLAISS
jgi:hypothetical protein